MLLAQALGVGLFRILVRLCRDSIALLLAYGSSMVMRLFANPLLATRYIDRGFEAGFCFFLVHVVIFLSAWICDRETTEEKERMNEVLGLKPGSSLGMHCLLLHYGGLRGFDKCY